jgi:hypothetical protein
MAFTQPPRQTNQLPAGYLAIPIHDPGESPLRLCVLVRQTPDPAAGHFVVLRDLHDALVYLGCVVDAGGQLREWVEIAVQNVDGLEASLPAYREAFSNHTLDQRWSKTAEAARELNPEQALRTGWELKHPLPTFLDIATQAPVHPTGNGGAWELCQKDELLTAAGLPPYSTSLFRYWYQPGAGGESKFVPTVAGAPTNARTCAPAEALAGAEGSAPFNPQGGLMTVSSFGPLGFEDYIDLLGGKPWKGIEDGKKFLTFQGVYEGLGEWNQTQQAGAHLFLGDRGRAGRFLETFHLKLQLLREATRLVRGAVQMHQLPFLNLGADSFRVKLNQVGCGLPFLWTANCLLVKPSHAYPLPVASSDFRYFICARSEGTSIYLPEGLSAASKGSGSVRIRKLLPPDQGRLTLEGTLVMQDKLNVSPHDLLWIRLPLPSGRLDLYGHLYTTEGLAQGEARFRTLPQQMPDSAAAALRSAEGVSFARSPFEVVPLLSSPCDLYALGVLAVRAFLVDDEATLAVSLDEVLSLARQVASEHKPDAPLGQRVRGIFERDARYTNSLGCHRLVREKIEPAAAAQLLPANLWHDTLGAILRFFPGMGPDSICKDFGDAPSLALETVFNQPLEELEKLLVRSRSLILIDWNANREIHGAIKAFLERNKS